MIFSLGPAIGDIVYTVRNPAIWLELAREDVEDQYRRTLLGPLWLLVNYLVYVGAFLAIFGKERGGFNFGAYVALGMLVWIYISEALNQAIKLFSREEKYILGTTLPLTVYVMRLTLQSFIRIFYSIIGCIVLVIFSGVDISWVWLWSLFGLLLVGVTTPAAIMVFAMMGAFFPDMQFVVQNALRVGLFLTPIFWVPTASGIRGILYKWNPFTYFLEIIREPVFNAHVPWMAIGFCLLVSLFLWGIGLVLLVLYRKQIVFVL
jgi:lipopolysaccharide transport system permease protein